MSDDTNYDLELEVDLGQQQEKINKLLEYQSKKSNIVLKDAQTRNIILLGRTRSGKSQCLKTMKDPFKFSTQLGIFSDTKEPSLQSFTMEYDMGGEKKMNYNFNIIDTPGLYEQKKEKSDARNNELIKATITKCLEFEITKIHAIFFVCSFTGGINQEDVESILQLNDLFQGANKTISLLVTRCEGKVHKSRLELEAQIRAIPTLQNFFDTNDVKIFFSGALDPDDYTSGSFDSIRNKLQNVLVLRTALYQHFFSCENHCHITELDFFRKQRDNILELRKQVEDLQVQLETFKGTAEEKDYIQEKLEEETKKLSSAVEMISRVTGQNFINVETYADVVKKSLKLGERKY